MRAEPALRAVAGVWREGILDPPRVLHGDNGSPLKGATVQALLGRLGITASFSRPRVSDDNARSLSRAQSLTPLVTANRGLSRASRPQCCAT